MNSGVVHHRIVGCFASWECSIIFGLFNITFTMYRDVPKVSGHCNFLLYISYKTTTFENIIPVNSCLILMKFLPTEVRSENVCNFLWLFLNIFWKHILNFHDLNAYLNYLSSNVLSLYCIFDVQNFALCLNMLKSLCKTTFNSVFVGKKIIKIEQESTLE